MYNIKIPSYIELIYDLPSSIILDASLIPSSIDLKFPDDLLVAVENVEPNLDYYVNYNIPIDIPIPSII